MLLVLLAAATIAVVRVRNLFAVVVISGSYSFLMASLFILLDAVDVAMTEASVGAGVATVLMLGALHLTKTTESVPAHSSLVPLFVAGITAAVLIWGAEGLPAFGDPNAPIHTLGPDYLARSLPDTHIPNVVTSVLASYRGFDTLGEVTVIFTAAIGVLVLLKRTSRRSAGSGE